MKRCRSLSLLFLLLGNICIAQETGITLIVNGHFIQNGVSVSVGNNNSNQGVTIKVSGNFIEQGGIFLLNSGSGTGNDSLTIMGDFNQSNSSVMNMSSTTGEGRGFINLSGNFLQTGGAALETSQDQDGNIFTFNGLGVQQFNSASPENNTNMNWVVTANDTLALASNLSLNNDGSGSSLIVSGALDASTKHVEAQLSGTNSSFSLEAGATLITANPDGVSGSNGSIITSGGSAIASKSFSSGANYSFNSSSSNQISGFYGTAPISMHNLTINTPAHQVTLSESAEVDGTLTLKNGRIILTDNDLSLNSSDTIAGSPFSSARMIVPDGTGKLIRNFGTTGQTSFLFPVGDYSTAKKYSPVTITATSGNFDNAIVNVNLKDTKDPNELSYPSYLKRYWDISNSGSGSFTYTIDLDYDPDDVTGTESILRCARYVDPSWSYYGFVTTTSGQHKISIPGLNSFGEFSALGYATIASNDGPACTNQTLHLSSGPDGQSSYTWSGPNGFTSDSQNPSIDNVTTAASGIYSVTVTDASSFSAVNSTEVGIKQSPDVAWPGTLATQCITASAYALTGGTPYGGIYSGPGVTETNFDASIAGEGSHTLTYEITGSNGCISPATNSIIVYPLRNISGTFSYYNTAGTPIENNITVRLYQDGLQAGSDYQVTSGSYAFSGLCPGTYEIRASSASPTEGSVNSTDAVVANYWSVFPYPIEKVRFFAGDVKDGLGNGQIFLNSTDALQIQQYFVTAGSSSFDRPSWVFWNAGQTISSNPIYPSEYYPVYPTITITGSSNITSDFYGLCTGDFNRSYIPGLKSSVASGMQLKYDAKRQINTGQEFELPVRISNSCKISAISLVLDFPPDLVEIKDIRLKDRNETVSWAIKKNEVRIGWNSLVAYDVAGSSDLLILKMKTTPAYTDESIVKIGLIPGPLNELADEQYNSIENIVLSTDLITGASSGSAGPDDDHGFSLQNHPNPFSTYTMIDYRIPFDAKVILEIHDIVGQTVETLINEDQTTGNHTVRFTARNLPAGIYTARISVSNDRNELRKTIKLLIDR
jgi:hypothetical protein